MSTYGEARASTNEGVTISPPSVVLTVESEKVGEATARAGLGWSEFWIAGCGSSVLTGRSGLCRE